MQNPKQGLFSVFSGATLSLFLSLPHLPLRGFYFRCGRLGEKKRKEKKSKGTKVKRSYISFPKDTHAMGESSSHASNFRL